MPLLLQKLFALTLVIPMCYRNKVDFDWFGGAAKSEWAKAVKGAGEQRKGWIKGRRTTLNKWPEHRIIEAGRTGTASTFTLR